MRSALCLSAWLLAAPGLSLAAAEAADASTKPPVITVEDRVDPVYGAKIRVLRKDDGHEHNLYYHRDPWNADGTRLIVIHSDLAQKNWRLALCDGEGQFLKYLFTPADYDWRIVWDRHDPDLLYTSRGAALYRYRVSTGRAELLKKFSAPLRPTGASLNQAGDRILVATTDWTFHSLALAHPEDERTFRPPVPPNYNSDKPGYTGYADTIHVPYSAGDGSGGGIRVFTDTGQLVHDFQGLGGGGHYDFSPDGQLAYFRFPRTNAEQLEIHVVKLDGTGDRIVFAAPRAKLRYVQNLHLSWPDKVSDWFVASFFPNATSLPASYAPLLDEIVRINVDGTHRVLARSETAHSRGGKLGATDDLFWAQPLASPSADGRRIAFNSIRAGTVDVCILQAEPKP